MTVLRSKIHLNNLRDTLAQLLWSDSMTRIENIAARTGNNSLNKRKKVAASVFGWLPWQAERGLKYFEEGGVI